MMKMKHYVATMEELFQYYQSNIMSNKSSLKKIKQEVEVKLLQLVSQLVTYMAKS